LVALQPTRGAVAVDEAFLGDLESWRGELGVDILRRNTGLEPWQLDDATQRILDRLVFIRVIEDRQVETDVLLRKFARITDSYAALCRHFRRFDAVYNGTLFAEHWSEDLEISDPLIQRMSNSQYLWIRNFQAAS
jgi:adenine-specific DNA-methyltransferase